MIRQAFDSFMQEDFYSAVDSSTRESWSGGGYSVELFSDGKYRVLWDKEIGNLYDSPGLILSIPALTNDDWDEDPDIRFYDNVEEEIRNSFQDRWLVHLQDQAVIADR